MTQGSTDSGWGEEAGGQKGDAGCAVRQGTSAQRGDPAPQGSSGGQYKTHLGVTTLKGKETESESSSTPNTPAPLVLLLNALSAQHFWRVWGKSCRRSGVLEARCGIAVPRGYS